MRGRLRGGFAVVEAIHWRLLLEDRVEKGRRQGFEKQCGVRERLGGGLEWGDAV